MKIAIYAGSFDPITFGHLWMIEKSVQIFDKVIVAVGSNQAKSQLFTADERISMLNATLNQYINIEIQKFTGQFLVQYAQKIGAKYIIRGVRNHEDYEYEKMLRYINGDLSADIDTVFLIPPREYIEMSSSLVKNILSINGWQSYINKYVPYHVLLELKKKFNEQNS